MILPFCKRINGKSYMKLSTYLLFDGSCKPVMEYYAPVLIGELNIYLVGESRMTDMFPELMHHLVVNSTIASVNLKLSASDFLRTSEKLVQSNKLSLYIHGGSAKDIKMCTTAL
ncbi:hypothetical protein [Teredinibacter turnerae]|uniref:hypothetical protein n=1 Tax=Teredinibacter turnerae TaxID=2426 RepID=UPI000361173C|nr:hypothetical protein [Teredinibacter turnerae]